MNLPTSVLELDVTPGQFLEDFNKIHFRVFSFPRLVAIPRLKSLGCTSIHSQLGGGGGIIGSIPFPMVLALCEIRTASSRILKSATMSISNDDNYCTTGSIGEF